jgi:NAD(P)-dependent dehydrogenase (short-subunit alcohol dehydrogenase family)
MPTVLLTGTSTGIGNETALHLARAGYRVFATMRTPSKDTNLGAAAASESLDLHILKQDVTDPASNQATVDAVLEAAGHIDVLVNNAGLGGAASVEETPTELLRKIFDINFFGAMDLTQKVIPHMRQRRSGCIVNVTSVAGVVSVSPQFAYSSSKVALEAATEILAQEMRPFGVRVCTVEPGIVITPMLEQFAPPDAETPYLQQWERMGLFFEAGIRAGTMPGVVAEKIKAVIESNEFELRNLAGPDAAGIVGFRRVHNEEEWIATMGDELPIEEWKAMASKLSGIDL